MSTIRFILGLALILSVILSGILHVIGFSLESRRPEIAERLRVFSFGCLAITALLALVIVALIAPTYGNTLYVIGSLLGCLGILCLMGTASSAWAQLRARTPGDRAMYTRAVLYLGGCTVVLGLLAYALMSVGAY